MKRIVLLFVALCVSQLTIGQTSYSIVNSAANAGNPGLRGTLSDFTTTGQTNIHAYNAGGSNTTNYWSAAQAMPFTFEFFGQTVDSFCVSKNALLTFDVSVAGTQVGTGVNTNAALPSTDLPDNTVAIFWENFATSSLGTNDNVWMITRGSAPNRELEIHYYSYRMGLMTFSYFTLVLQESTNKIYMVDFNYKSNNCTATVGVQKDTATAIQVNTGINSTAGSPNVIMGTGGTASSDNEYYEFTPFLQVPTNVGIASIDSPGDSCGFDTNEVVTVTISNLGTATQTSIPVLYSLNGGSFMSGGTWTGSLASGATTTHTFPVNLSAVQTHNLVVTTNLTGDTVTNNDTATATITNVPIITSYPYNESWETGAGGWAAGGNNSTWERGVPANTNISAASDGTIAWVTDLDGQYDGDEQSYVLGPCFDLSTLTDPEVILDVYWDSEFSWDGAALQSTTDGGNTWNHVGSTSSGGNNWYNDGTINGMTAGGFSSSGNGWTGTGGNGSGGWVTAQHDLTGLGGNNEVRLRVLFGADGGGFGEGFGFDNIIVRQKPLNDAGVVSVDSPAGVCDSGASDTVVVTLGNAGANTIMNIPIMVSLNGGAYTSAGTFTDSIQSGMTATFQFPLTFGGVGDNTVSVAVNYTGDPDNSNDTASGIVVVKPLINAYPYSEDFETGNGGWTDGGANSSWELGTPANGTINTAGGGTMSWETNLTGNYNNSELSFVEGPCFDFSSLSNPEILMDVWWESETSWDGAALQSSVDGGQTWSHVGSTSSGGTNWYSDATINGFTNNSISGDGWSGYFGSGSGGWVNAKHDLTGLGGQSDVRLRVLFGSDGGGQGDGFAFDNVFIQEKPLNDLGISGLNSPNSGCGLGMESVQVILENFGAGDQDTFSISFQVNGGTIVTQQFLGTDTILALDTLHFGLDSLMDLSMSGNNNVDIWTTLAGDLDTSNDTFSIIINNESNVTVTYPVVEDWEGVGVGSSITLNNGWTTTSTTGNFGWESENSTGANENSGSTGPHYDNTTFGTPGGIYMYLEASSGSTGEEDLLISPCYDLTPLNNPAVEFYYHMYGSNMGTLHLEINSGGVWTSLSTTVGQQQTAGGDPWTKVTIDLAAYANQSVKFRFRAVKGNGFRSDMSVDDFRLFDVPINDAGVIDLDAPATSVITAGSQNVDVSIQNFGLDTLTTATINWTANGAAQTPFSWTGNLPTDSVDTNITLGTYNFPTGLTQLVFYTSMPNGMTDDDNANDTLEAIRCTPLSGNYQIGPTGDFANFNELVSILQTCGIGGPTTVTVQMGSGPYNEQVIFSGIGGLSATNTLTIKGNMETVTYAPLFSDKRIIGFDGVKHITIDSLTVTSGSPTYGWAFHFQNSSDSNTVTNCVIDLSNITSTGSTNSGGFIASGSITSTTTDGTNTNYSVFDNNQILGGSSGAPYQGFYLNGNGTGLGCVGNQITNNTCTDFYRFGVYLDEADGTIITGNDFSRPTRTAATTTQFITTQGKTENTLVEKNEFHNSHGGAPTNTSTTYVLYSTSNDADVTDENIYRNNLIYDINNNGTIYAIYNFSSNGQHYIHNTISLDNTASTAGTTRGFFQTTTASNLDFRNNIISITRGGSGQKHGIYLNATGTSVNSETNVLYINSAGSGLQYTGRYGTTNYATLANWQTANTAAYDQSSDNADPNFVNVGTGNLEPNSSSANNIGTNLGVSDDFFGVSRGTTPDPGAIEFDVATTDAGVVSIDAPGVPAYPNCALTGTDTVMVTIKNFGTTTITSVDVSFLATNGFTVTQTFSGLSIPFNGTTQVTFTQTANLSGLLAYDLDAWTSLTGDTDSSNDTVSKSETFGFAAPYFEDFESLSNEDNGVLANGWLGNQTTDPRWEAEDANGANENSTETGPFVDHTVGVGGIYMFTETSSGTAGQEMELESPCIDLSALTHPFARYWYHMHGNTMGDLYLDVYANGQWNPVDSIFGEQHPNQGDPWLSREVNLCEYSNIVRFRFRSVHGGIFRSDMAIDDFEVYDAPSFSDAGVALSADPQDYCQTPLPQVATYNFGAQVVNNGLTTNNNVTLNLTNNGVNLQTANIGAMVNCGPDTNFAFTNTFTPSAIGEYDIEVTVGITENDTVTNNDTSEYTIVVSDTVYARDDSAFTNGIGAAGVPITLAQLFELPASDTVTSSSFFLTNPVVGDSGRVLIYTDNGGVPGTLVDSTDYVTFTGAGWYNVRFCNQILSAGDYFFALEQNSTNNITLGYDLNKFNDSTAFFTTGGGVWTSIEAAGFPSAYLLRANFGRTLSLMVSGNDSICAGDSANIMANMGFDTYLWSNGDTTNSITVTMGGTYTVTVVDGNGCDQVDSFTVVLNPAVTAAITGTTDVSCNGLTDGSATVSAAGGTSPFIYLWSNGAITATASGLAAGTYTVTITDAAGCTDETSATISEPTVIVSSAVVDSNVTCNTFLDGGATASAAGGTMPYSYAWSNSAITASITGVAAGTYSVTVTDANGCTDSSSVTITEPTLLVATGSNDGDVTCNGDSDGAASVSATGGTGSYTYLWSNAATTSAITGLAGGTYTVTVTDANACTATASVTIAEPMVLSSTVDSSDNASCNGFTDGAVYTTTAGGTMPYTYAWSTGASMEDLSGVGVGTYTLTVTDANGCTATSSQALTEPTTLTAAIDSTHNVTCGGSDGAARVAATGGTMPYSYNWPLGGTNALDTGLVAGTYTVTVSDANGCTITATATITQPSTLTGSLSSTTNVSCNGLSDGAASVGASGGVTPYTFNWSNGTSGQSISGVVAGNYGCTITDANGCQIVVVANITEPAVLVAATAVDSNVTCNAFSDGGATASATGGTSPYSFAWSNAATTASITGVVAGTYSVTITDANGCTDSTSVTITEPAVLVSATVVDSNITCNGLSDGGATASATGGTMPYTYNWSNSATTASITGVMAGTYSVTVTDANGCTDSASVTITEPAVLVSATVVDSNVSCNGLSDGGATASATGGTMPYTYSWSNSATTASITGVIAGTYSVTVTDANGCTDSSSVTITEPATLVAASIVDSNVTCNGFSDGGATASATGGTMPYTYTWSNSAVTASITGVVAGTYSVTVTDANGCTDSSSVTITEPAALVSTAVTDSNVTCNGFLDGGATASATGGTMPYSYAWSNAAITASITGVAAGTYTVTVSDNNGCTSVSNATITEPTVLQASITGSTNVSCNGGSDGTATASGSGGTSPYSYLWSNASNTANTGGLAAGTYTVTITDNNGCTATTSVTITEPTQLLVTTAVDSNVTCNGLLDGGATATASGGTSPYTYNWSNAATTASITGVGAGTYTVTVTDANGCTNVSSAIITEPTVLVPATVVDSNISCNGLSDGGATASATGGTAPYTYSWSNAATTASITGVAAGNYTVTVTDANGCSDTATAFITEPAVLTASASVVNDVSCNGGSDGSATVAGAGGTMPYAYLWSNGDTSATASNLMAGTYTVVITDDNGCTATDSATVGEPAALAATTSTTDVNCTGGSDGSGSITVTGGTMPYAYVWSDTSLSGDSISGVMAGTYHVTVTDDNGCTLTDSLVIGTANSLPTINLGGDADFCPEDSLTLDAGAGFTYMWSTGATTQTITTDTAGTYWVVITDGNGCMDSDTVTLGTYAPVIVTTSATDATCELDNDGSATATLTSGTAPYAYLWSDPAMQTTDVATGLAPGTYGVLVTDSNGCSGVDTVTVGFTNPAPVVNLPATDTLCIPFTYDIDAGGGFASYAWSTGDTTQVITTDSAGTYSVTVTDANGCTGEGTIDLVGDPCTAIEPTLKDVSVNYFPNPTNGLLNMELKGMDGEDITVTIVSLQGQIIFNERIENVPETFRRQFNLSEQAQGIYLVRVTSDSRSLVNRVSVK